MPCTARALVMRSLALATAGLLSPRPGAGGGLAQRRGQVRLTGPLQGFAAVVQIQPGKRPHMIDVVVHAADVVGVVADEVGEDAGPAEAAVERLLRVGVAVALRRRLA